MTKKGMGIVSGRGLELRSVSGEIRSVTREMRSVIIEIRNTSAKN